MIHTMYENSNVIITGLYFGDETKGAWTAFFAEQSKTDAVVRFSGGCQAAHNFVSEKGQHHTFAQFTAGTFSGIPTILSKHMMVEPYALAKEGQKLSNQIGANVFNLLTISENSLITTPVHSWINRKLEDQRGTNRHGSTGLGIGETTRFSLQFPDIAIRMKDLKNRAQLKEKFATLVLYAEQRTGEVYGSNETNINQYIEDYLAMAEDGVFGKIKTDDDILQTLNKGRFVFEGSQGVLLDEDLGFHPHTTWSKTTSENARMLLADAGAQPGVVVGLVRKYGTRHGAGPFPGEFTNNPPVELPEPHNGTGEYQGNWRTGYLALPLVEYAVRANKGVDAIAVSHWDAPINKFISKFDEFPHIPSDFFSANRKQQAHTIQQITDAAENPTYEQGEENLLAALTKTAKAPVIALASSPTSAGRKFV